MGYLEYQNIFQLPKVANRIDVKGPIPEKICGDCMKSQQQKKLYYKPILQLTGYLEYLHFNLGGLYPTT